MSVTISDIHRAKKGFGLISLGFRLVKKPDKTELEQKAAKSFLQFFWGIMALIACFIVTLCFIFAAFSQIADRKPAVAYDEARTGKIESGQIRVVKNTMHYLNPADFGLNPAELCEGDSINVYFDENDNAVAALRAETEKLDTVLFLLIFDMVFFCVALIVFAVAGRKTFGKPWGEWLRSIGYRS